MTRQTVSMKKNWKVNPISLRSRYYCKNQRVVQTLMSNVALHISVGRIGSCSRKVTPIFNRNMPLNHAPFEGTSTQKTL
jgi:hypothetical protein